MQKTRNILIFILIPGILLAGLPVFLSEDVDYDGRVGLKDAILSVRMFVQTAEQPETFTSSVRDTVSAFQAAVGLKTVIKKSEDKSISYAPPVYLLPAFNFSDSLSAISVVSEPGCLYSTNLIPPDTPPPRSYI